MIDEEKEKSRTRKRHVKAEGNLEERRSSRTIAYWGKEEDRYQSL